MIKFEKVSEEQFVRGVFPIFLAEKLPNSKDEETQITQEISEIYKKIKLPERSTTYSAGYDFRVPYKVIINPKETLTILTGIKCKMENDMYLGLYIRSSLSTTLELSTGVSIIDADYYGNSGNEGHIKLMIKNKIDKPITLNQGEKIVQGVISKYITTDDDEFKNGIKDNVERIGGVGSTTTANENNVQPIVSIEDMQRFDYLSIYIPTHIRNWITSFEKILYTIKMPYEIISLNQDIDTDKKYNIKYKNNLLLDTVPNQIGTVNFFGDNHIINAYLCKYIDPLIDDYIEHITNFQINTNNSEITNGLVLVIEFLMQQIVTKLDSSCIMITFEQFLELFLSMDEISSLKIKEKIEFHNLLIYATWDINNDSINQINITSKYIDWSNEEIMKEMAPRKTNCAKLNEIMQYLNGELNIKDHSLEIAVGSLPNSISEYVLLYINNNVQSIKLNILTFPKSKLFYLYLEDEFNLFLEAVCYYATHFILDSNMPDNNLSIKNFDKKYNITFIDVHNNKSFIYAIVYPKTVLLPSDILSIK